MNRVESLKKTCSIKCRNIIVICHLFRKHLYSFILYYQMAYSLPSDSNRSANAKAIGSAQFRASYISFHTTHFSPPVHHDHIDLWRYSHLTQGRLHALLEIWYVSDQRWVPAVICLTSPIRGRSNRSRRFSSSHGSIFAIFLLAITLLKASSELAMKVVEGWLLINSTRWWKNNWCKLFGLCTWGDGAPGTRFKE